jgi:hypothetical protein
VRGRSHANRGEGRDAYKRALRGLNSCAFLLTAHSIHLGDTSTYAGKGSAERQAALHRARSGKIYASRAVQGRHCCCWHHAGVTNISRSRKRVLSWADGSRLLDWDCSPPVFPSVYDMTMSIHVEGRLIFDGCTSRSLSLSWGQVGRGGTRPESQNPSKYLRWLYHDH